MSRFSPIDQLRALAIISWMIAIFLPGVIPRVPALAAYNDAILFWGRFATVTFVFVFGITTGFLYQARFQPGHRLAIAKHFWRRSIKVGICAIIICIPNYVDLIGDRVSDPNEWMFATYSVLNFYTVAVLSAPLWLLALQRNAFAHALLLSASHWALAFALLHIFGQTPTHGLPGYIGVFFIWGPYAYLQAAGCAILAIPIGAHLRKSVEAGRQLKFIALYAPVSIAICLAGLTIGLFVVQEWSLHAIATASVKSPPRFWYWMFFSGPALLALLALVYLNLRFSWTQKVLYPLTLFGQAALPLFTAHVFVRPSLKWLDAVVVIEGIGRILLSFAGFGLFCTAVLWHRACLNRRAERPKAQSVFQD